MIRDFDLAILSAGDSRRIEVIVDVRGCSIGSRCNHSSPVRVDGCPREGGVVRNGVALTTARRRKQWIYPEFSGHQHRCRFVVLAQQLDGGLWKPATYCVP